MHTNQQHRHNPERWGMIITLLSMDYTHPFLSPMGLSIPDQDKLKALLRKLILENRALYERDTDKVPALAERVFDECRKLFGSDFFQHFLNWGEKIFKHSPQDQLDLRHWQFIVSLCRESPRRDWLFPDTVQAQVVVSRLNESLSADDVFDTDEALGATELSEWDLQMYSRHGFNEDTMSPFTWIVNTVRQYRFQQFWIWLCGFLSQNELEQLYKGGQKAIQEVEPLRFIDDLKHPKQVLAQL
jgi:hypothetical protein